jgi:hypothetical protein
MNRYTKKVMRYGAYLASISALGIIGWLGMKDDSAQTSYSLDGVIDHAEADDVGSSGDGSVGSSGDGSSGDGSGDGGDGSGDGSGCSSGCSSA